MNKLQLTEIEPFIKSSRQCLIIFGDTTSVLTKSINNLLKNINCELRVVDTEENLEAYVKYRIRTTPLIHVYVSGNLIDTFTLPITKETVERCLIH